MLDADFINKFEGANNEISEYRKLTIIIIIIFILIMINHKQCKTK